MGVAETTTKKGKRGMNEKPKNILQPRLVNPPMKLTKERDLQGIPASHMPKKAGQH